MSPFIVHMTGAQLREAFDKLGWSMDDACRLLDQERRRINCWLHDDQRIPRWVPLLLALADLPDGEARLNAVDQHLLWQQHEQANGERRC